MAQINKPDEYFNTKLYTGTGATHNVTGVGFQPDWVWINNRTGTYATTIFDAVRGATKFLEPAGTPADQTYADTLTSFDSDGFTLGADTSSFCNRGSAPNSYVAWNWLGANGTASNTDGSITSTVSASTTSGFSIVSWTGNATYGATVGHGLGSAPKMIIVKNRTDAVNWYVFHESIGNGKALSLNLTNVSDTSTDYWNDTSPTSSVFSLGNFNATNGSSDDMIAYCFAEKKGFSKAFSYTGNGSADGSFCYLGFKPSFILCRDPNNAENWFMFDNKRPGYNVNANLLYANDTATETTSGANQIDLLSNGFKMRATNNGMNRSGGTFIGFAFAESPLVGTNNIPATAR
jgi:hypothetical protein